MREPIFLYVDREFYSKLVSSGVINWFKNYLLKDLCNTYSLKNFMMEQSRKFTNFIVDIKYYVVYFHNIDTYIVWMTCPVTLFVKKCV